MSNEGVPSINEFLMYFSNIQNENSMRIIEVLSENGEVLKNVQRLLENINSKIESFHPDPLVGAKFDQKLHVKETEPGKQLARNASTQEMVSEKTSEASESESFLTPTMSSVEESPTESKNIGVAMDETKDESLEDSKSTEIYCYDCKRYFVRGSGKFTRHVRETPCKPYQCHCGKLFKKKSSLKGHKSTHSLDEFPCQCGAIFRCEQYLKNHERRKHCVALKAKGSVTAAKRIFENIIVKPEQNTSETSLEESYFTPMNLLRLQMQD